MICSEKIICFGGLLDDFESKINSVQKLSYNFARDLNRSNFSKQNQTVFYSGYFKE
jgi:hypothetical protein